MISFGSSTCTGAPTHPSPPRPRSNALRMKRYASTIRAAFTRDSEWFAQATIDRLIDAVDRLVLWPRSGRIVSEIGDDDLREPGDPHIFSYTGSRGGPRDRDGGSHFARVPITERCRPTSGGARAAPHPLAVAGSGGTVDDDLEDAALEQWPAIQMVYERFSAEKPVMLFDIQEQRIYAYPYAEFRNELNARSQRLLEEQYENAVHASQIVVFVRDNVRRRLVSFSFDRE